MNAWCISDFPEHKYAHMGSSAYFRFSAMVAFNHSTNDWLSVLLSCAQYAQKGYAIGRVCVYKYMYYMYVYICIRHKTALVWHLPDQKISGKALMAFFSYLEVMNVTVDCWFIPCYSRFFAYTCVPPEEVGHVIELLSNAHC